MDGIVEPVVLPLVGRSTRVVFKLGMVAFLSFLAPSVEGRGLQIVNNASSTMAVYIIVPFDSGHLWVLHC